MASQSVQPFSQGSRSLLTDRPTERTDHATPSAAIGLVHI